MAKLHSSSSEYGSRGYATIELTLCCLLSYKEPGSLWYMLSITGCQCQRKDDQNSSVISHCSKRTRRGNYHVPSHGCYFTKHIVVYTLFHNCSGRGVSRVSLEYFVPSRRIIHVSETLSPDLQHHLAHGSQPCLPATLEDTDREPSRYFSDKYTESTPQHRLAKSSGNVW